MNFMLTEKERNNLVFEMKPEGVKAYGERREEWEMEREQNEDNLIIYFKHFNLKNSAVNYENWKKMKKSDFILGSKVTCFFYDIGHT